MIIKQIILTSKEDDLMPHIIKEFDISYERYGRLNSRTGQQIGFVGVIIAIFSFTAQSLTVLSLSTAIHMAGIVLLVISIIVSIFNLTTKMSGNVNMKHYVGDGKDELDKKSLIHDYQDSTDELDKLNGKKAHRLDLSYILTIFGLTISSIAIIWINFSVV
jgi:hypothetical protein